jgi:hypothetical protein
MDPVICWALTLGAKIRANNPIAKIAVNLRFMLWAALRPNWFACSFFGFMAPLLQRSSRIL